MAKRGFTIKNGKAVVRSDKVAKVFEKQHKDILERIRRNIEKFEDIEVGTRRVRGKDEVCFYLSKNDFDILKILLSKKRTKSNIVYLLKADKFYKIGVTNSDITKRVKALQTGNPYKIEIISYIRTQKALNIEHKLHNKFCDKRMVGEWFELDVNDVVFVLEIFEKNKKKDIDV